MMHPSRTNTILNHSSCQILQAVNIRISQDSMQGRLRPIGAPLRVRMIACSKELNIILVNLVQYFKCVF